MRIEQKTSIQNSIGRLIISALSLLLQILWLVFLALKLTQYSTLVEVGISVVAFALAMWVYDLRNLNSNYKTPWIFLILAFPILGLTLFLLFGNRNTKKARRRMDRVHSQCLQTFRERSIPLEALEDEELGIVNQFAYLVQHEKYPLYSNTAVKFYATAETGYEDIVDAVKKAKKYIYMEYFAIQPRSAFLRLQEILLEKISEGVEVRIMYDDVGSIGFLNGGFAKEMQALGIKCRAFNRVSPAFRLYMNNRDHRKITVVDGKVAFTGGFNIADEYFNITHPYGHWKDTGVRLEGDAVESLLCMFLEMWNSTEDEQEDLARYHLTAEEKTESNSKEYGDGYVLPYADSPLDESRVGENVYLNMIGNAKKTLYITTPYLILSDEMKIALQLAALRGVDVRIVLPGIPDKRVVYRLSRSYYHDLMRAGVKIYEYTPGFIHCKQFVADDELAIVGTINLDFRSLFLHFENGVLLYKVDAVHEVTKDMLTLFEQSNLVQEPFLEKQKLHVRIVNCFLRIIAPLI